MLDDADSMFDAPDGVLDAPDGVLDAPDDVLDAPDDVSDVTDGVFCEADRLLRPEFVNYLTLSRQPIGLTLDPDWEIWIRGS